MTPTEAFATVDLRVGRIQRAEPNEKARKPSFKLWIDFGPSLGIRQSSAQLTEEYLAVDLIGRQVVAAVNLGEKNIAGFVSQVLTLGVPNEAGHVVLLQPEREAPLGVKVF
jgi:tRNA-binding protein